MTTKQKNEKEKHFKQEKEKQFKQELLKNYRCYAIIIRNLFDFCKKTVVGRQYKEKTK